MTDAVHRADETRPCVRGCTMLRRHLDECDDEKCRGCLPRRAEHGNLCWPCHRRFEMMLHDSPIVFRWLTGNLAAGQGAARAKDDFERGGPRKVAGSPAPLKVMILDVRDLLRDRLAMWVDDLCESQNLTGPDRHTVPNDVKFLRAWLPTIEWLDWVGDWWEELAETMTDAHALAPWRPPVRRVPGVPCPECEEVNLIIFGGESDVTCGSCRLIIPEVHFGLWEQILGEEKASA